MSVTNIHELRASLSRTLEKVSNGELTPAAANAAANVSGKVLATIKMELDFSKASGYTPSIDFLTKTSDSKLLEHVDSETGEVTPIKKVK